MKREVSKFIRSLGGIPKYSGKEKTMYILSDTQLQGEAIKADVISHFGNKLFSKDNILLFKLHPQPKTFWK